LESLLRITYPNYTVILIDNASEDDSLAQIHAYCAGQVRSESVFFKYDLKNKPIKILEYSREESEAGEDRIDEILNIPSNRKMVLIKNERNYGFAEGNNIGIRFAIHTINSDYILLLNNDTAVDKNFLDELVKVTKKDKMIGFVGPKIYYYNKKGRTDIISHAGGTLSYWRAELWHIGDDEVDTGQYDEIREVNYLTGACLLVPRSVINHIGLLNPEYFLYWEDTDWCIRGGRFGYKCLYVPKAQIWHKIGGSNISTITEYYSVRNRFFFMQDNAPRFFLFTFLMYYFGYKFWRMCLSRLIDHKNPLLFKAVVRGTIDGLRYKR
jgi:GT2 family glycosyltransferase